MPTTEPAMSSSQLQCQARCNADHLILFGWRTVSNTRCSHSTKSTNGIGTLHLMSYGHVPKTTSQNGVHAPNTTPPDHSRKWKWAQWEC